MDERPTETAMARETGEIPALAARLLARTDLFASIVERIARAKPRNVVFCGRGSSGHVGVYLRYLFETRLGLLASASAPSVMTAYHRAPDLRNALFIVISQSGSSPDLVKATDEARKLGALTLAVINSEGSPAAGAAELVLPIGAGPEHSVAATKTVVLSMMAGAQLVAGLAHEDALSAGLQQLPQRFLELLKCDWSNWSDRTATAAAAFVIGRGYGLGCVREIALKVAEILCVPALGYSAAELQHGPRASITAATPILVLRQNDESATTVDQLAEDLKKAGAMIFTAGSTGNLRWIGDDHPVCDPIGMLIPAYRAIEVTARQRGLDPDNPPHLTKITRTV